MGMQNHVECVWLGGAAGSGGFFWDVADFLHLHYHVIRLAWGRSLGNLRDFRYMRNSTVVRNS